MKTIALALAGLLLLGTVPLRAQVPAQPQPPRKEKPAPKCPCDSSDFKPLTEKARAAEAYWDARRKTKIAAVIGGTGTLFSLLFGDVRGANNSVELYDKARSEMYAARAKAESLGAVTVVGDDLDGDIVFHLQKGVDY